MQIAQGLAVTVSGGHVLISYDVASALNPVLASLKQKVITGEVDVLKGTDLDTMAILGVIDLIQKELSK